MAGLVDELLQAATDPAMSTPNLLRKAKVVAAKLKQTETAAWIAAELTGKFLGSEAPEYRHLAAKLFYRNPYYGFQPLTFDNAEMNEIISSTRAVGQPIAELETLVSAEHEMVYVGIPPQAAQTLCEMGAPSPELYHAVTRAAVAGLLEAVRTRVLDWALELDSKGVHGENMSFSAEETARAEGITINVNGTIENFAGVLGTSQGVGAQHVVQTAINNEAAARTVAERLRAGAIEVTVPAEGALLNMSADGIEHALEAKSPGMLKKALGRARDGLRAVASWGAKTVAEHEIDQLLDSLL